MKCAVRWLITHSSVTGRAHNTVLQHRYGVVGTAQSYIARIHYDNKNILFLLLKIVKFVKHLFDFITSTMNTEIE